MRIEDLEKIKTTVQLLTQLEAGEKSAREENWLSTDDVEEKLGL